MFTPRRQTVKVALANYVSNSDRWTNHKRFNVTYTFINSTIKLLVYYINS